MRPCSAPINMMPALSAPHSSWRVLPMPPLKLVVMRNVRSSTSPNMCSPTASITDSAQ